MRVSGAAEVHASQEAVWAALTDPALLSLAVAGLDQIDFAGDGSCQFTLTTAITAIRGSYVGEARVVDRAESGVCILRVSATGVKGKVGADVTIRLASAADGVTKVSYTADADVEGPIAGIGHRMLVSIAKRLATDALAGLDAALAAPAPSEAGLAAEDGPGGALPATASGQAAIEQARRGIGLRGERMPAVGRPGSAVRTGLLAGAAAGVTGIVIGVVLGKRRGRR